MNLNHLVLDKFKDQEPFQKTYFETQLFSENNLVYKSSFK